MSDDVNTIDNYASLTPLRKRYVRGVFYKHHGFCRKNPAPRKYYVAVTYQVYERRKGYAKLPRKILMCYVQSVATTQLRRNCCVDFL